MRVRIEVCAEPCSVEIESAGVAKQVRFLERRLVLEQSGVHLEELPL